MAKSEKAAELHPPSAEPETTLSVGPKPSTPSEAKPYRPGIPKPPHVRSDVVTTPSGYRVLIAGVLHWRRGEVIPAGAIDADTLVRLYSLAAISPVFDVSPSELERAPETMPGRGGSDVELPFAVPPAPPLPGPVQPPPPMPPPGPSV